MELKEKEIWKDIIGYEGLYQVSNFGNVKSLDREVVYNDGRVYNYYEKILTPFIGTHGYYSLCLSGKRFCNHQLVAIVFLGHKPCGKKIVINHKDNNPLNNHVDNLEIVTTRYNTSCHKKNESGFTGVKKRRYGFESELRITIDNVGKKISVGNFITKEIAFAHR